MGSIAFGNFRDAQGPIDPEPWIRDIECAFRSLRIILRMQVKQFGILFQGLESMGETFRDAIGIPIFGREFHAMPGKKGGRIRTEIHGHVEGPAAQAHHDLGLRMGRELEMQSSYRAFFPRDGMIDLRQRFLQTDPVQVIEFAEFPGAE